VWLYLNQTGGALSGTLIGAERDGFGTTKSDPGRPGSIDAQSNFTITFDLRRGQLTLVGQVSRGLYGYQLTGTAHGAGFSGDRFDLGESTYAAH
jgi:hypothetical protein